MNCRNTVRKILTFILKGVGIYLLILFTFFSIPAIQKLWDESGIMDSISIFGGKVHNERFAVIGDSQISISIADSEKERIRGLSGKEKLASNAGMLFVFDKSDQHGIWMKDMNFSIDIIWINNQMNIVHIEENVSPDTYPNIFQPEDDARYVLEVPAGFVIDAGINIGDLVSLL